MDFNDSYDVVVIGGGPAGACFAKQAASKGLDVIIFDKRKEIGSPVKCGEGLGAHWNYWKLPINEKSIACNIEGAAAIAPNGKELVLQNDYTKGFVLERKIFDKFLAIEAGRAGAHVRAFSRVTDLIKENGKIAGVKVRYLGEEFDVKAKLVVSAEGMENLIARKAGIAKPANAYDVDTCFEYELVNVDCSRRFIELFFGEKIAPRGYVWVFPKADDVANVGVGVGGHLGLDPRKLMDEFIKANPERYGKAECVEVKGGVISVGAPLKSLVTDNFMVIGTAAHQVDPIHGGGMGLAMEAGIIAADVAVAAFEKNDLSAKSLMPYQEKWLGAEEDKLEKRLKLRKVLEVLSDDDFNHIFNQLSNDDLDMVLKGNFAIPAAKVLAKRPSLLKVLGPISGIR
ncbi:MAG: geranylgeranyl reductase family protein [Candidatus Micrarchaeota archaeon]